MEETYRVVVQGLQEGFSRERAAEKLAALFKSPQDRIQSLLEPKKTVVKKGLSQSSATQYKDALGRCGCVCRIEPEAVAAALRTGSEPRIQANDPPAQPLTLNNRSPYLDPESQATDAGAVTLSAARLREIQPELLSENWSNANNRQSWIQLITDQLQHGDSRAAVVVNAQQAIVAAYTDELDCVALLKFDPNIAQTRGWKIGTRLLTVNIYVLREKGVASDLTLGPKDTGSHGNFRALIADLLTDDLERVEYRKSQISESEWSRALEMGRQALAKPDLKPRDGRPLNCGAPAKAEVKASVKPKPTAKVAKAAEILPPTMAAQIAAAMLVCFWLTWLGVSHIRDMPVDLLYFIAWFGILLFGGVGLYCARVVFKWTWMVARGQ